MELVRGGGGAGRGKTVFRKITLPRVKQEKNCNVEHQSDTEECLYNIGFHSINPGTLSLVIPTRDSLDRSLAPRLMSIFHRLYA